MTPDYDLFMLPFASRLEASPWIDYWTPRRSGHEDTDRRAGAEHFETALHLLSTMADPERQDFYISMTFPREPDGRAPLNILTAIIGSMKAVGPMEAAFIKALARKALAGRPIEPRSVSEEDRQAEVNALALLGIARGFGIPEIIETQLTDAVHGIYDAGDPFTFVWTICAAATAGAMN
jgi:hypothetical protein